MVNRGDRCNMHFGLDASAWQNSAKLVPARQCMVPSSLSGACQKSLAPASNYRFRDGKVVGVDGANGIPATRDLKLSLQPPFGASNLMAELVLEHMGSILLSQDLSPAALWCFKFDGGIGT